eukprot:3834535-Alexandrium_andersonii.AAC.1
MPKLARNVGRLARTTGCPSWAGLAAGPPCVIGATEATRLRLPWLPERDRNRRVLWGRSSGA